MLERLLDYLHNYFVLERRAGRYAVSGGRIVLPFLLPGQRFRIVGSALNDGLYEYGDPVRDGDGNFAALADEEFDGEVWALGIPRGVVALASDIAEWESKYGEAASSPYSSESFGGYSYQKGGSGSGSGDGGCGWEGAFASRLGQYRKLPGST